MSTTKILPMTYHQQDTNYYCGAACAQMVLHSFNLPLADQNVLYDENHAHSLLERDWYTGPDGLAWTMRRYDPGNHDFGLSALEQEEDISRKIARTIQTEDTPSIALVLDWKHWIVVHGYTATAPADATGNFTIQSFDVNNPWPPVPSFFNFQPPVPPPPPPHGVDDGCGSGVLRGLAQQNISYLEWQRTYMIGVPAGYWAGKFIALTGQKAPLRPAMPTGLRLARRISKRKPTRKLLKPSAAIKLALLGLKEHGLTKRRNYASVLDQTRTGEPLLVQRLDRLDSFYYIIPRKDKSGAIAMVIAVDAVTGDYLESAVRSASSGGIFPMLDPQEARARVIGHAIDMPDKQGRLVIRKQAAQLYPHLVWRPCRESLSPFCPFYMFTVGREHIYVGLDGLIFTELRNGRGL